MLQLVTSLLLLKKTKTVVQENLLNLLSGNITATQLNRTKQVRATDTYKMM